MNWLHYLAEANLYLGVFYLAYRVFLAKETYNQLSRVYLLFSCLAAFTLPVLQLGILKPAEPVTTYSYTVTPLNYESMQVATQQATPVVIEHQLTWQDYLIYIYAAGCCILLLLLFVKLFTLAKLISNAKRGQHDDYKLVYLPETDVAFSFFNYLFIGTQANGANTIIRHELVHINQKHSLDILFLELLKIINWFNPFIYLLQHSLKTIHEYIADEQTAAHEADPIAYSTFLVNNAYGAGGSSITHSFFNYNLLKKRIIMLNQQRSGSSARLKYLIAAPLCAALLCASTLAFSKDYGFIDLDPAKPVVKVETAPTVAPMQTPAQIPAKHTAVKFPPPPPPMGVADNYFGLAHHLDKTLAYSPSKNIRDGLATVSFSISADHKLADARITKSVGPVRDAAVLKALEDYKFNINDKPGKNYLARFYYFKDDYSIFKNKDWPANCKLDVLVEIWPRTYSTTSKGFEYDLDRTMTVTKQTHMWHLNGVTIFGKNGEAERFEPATADANKLKEKYGFVWPVYTAASNIKRAQNKIDKYGGRIERTKLHDAMLPYQANVLYVVNGKKQELNPNQIKEKTLVAITCDSMTVYEKGNAYARAKWGNDVGKVVVLHGNASVNLINWSVTKNEQVKPKSSSAQKLNPFSPSDSLLAVYDHFAQEISRNVKYAKADMNRHLSGRTIAEFSTDDDGNLQYLKIVRTESNWQANEVIRVLKRSATLNKFPKGNWVVPVTFALGQYQPDGSLAKVPVDADGEAQAKAEAKAAPLETYNPKNIAEPADHVLMLNEVVIRGFIPDSKG